MNFFDCANFFIVRCDTIFSFFFMQTRPDFRTSELLRFKWHVLTMLLSVFYVVLNPVHQIKLLGNIEFIIYKNACKDILRKGEHKIRSCINDMLESTDNEPHCCFFEFGDFELNCLIKEVGNSFKMEKFIVNVSIKVYHKFITF